MSYNYVTYHELDIFFVKIKFDCNESGRMKTIHPSVGDRRGYSLYKNFETWEFLFLFYLAYLIKIKLIGRSFKIN